ncbi:MAG: BMP family ABC transporter substrate-binding protein [Rhodobacteraceae bacterium]|jgi:basic membrane protein A|nr:BMP family ABC transporter substrate-binding protein [Paracoccaceae bacterium]
MSCKTTFVASTALALLLAIPALAEDRPAALIISQSGLGDQSYNDLAYAGFERATGETGIEGRTVESKEVVAQADEILRRASDAGFGLILDLEFAHGEPIAAVAKDYPDINYVILNQEVPGDNIASVVFREQEGSYLAGVLAAQMTTLAGVEGINEQPVLGVIGGTKSAGIDKFIAGFIEGAKSVDPAVDVKVAYSNSFADPAIGMQMANAMFDEGADIVYHIAGGTGIGVIEAAKERGHFAIGVDTDQDGLAPGHVLTSMIKRGDVAVERIVKDYAADAFPRGQTISLGLAEDGVGLSEMEHTRDIIPAEVLARVDAARAGILDGSIKVWDVLSQGTPDYMK